ncbi:hypothetical protein GYMLUDRAFT_593930 [Collybiopsis luxurians FD-317 M1]|uniref:Uncharacterized protein n=1 Tax=Collybiopsis luxurians FD-317 M1 TaxID=944289 RepID=A0A0D0CFB8_9AGAR|nr:hypothetical protein GYMLUDRAFT_593930 [Collybiopsis luxurians FD-317 M1]
MAAIPTPDTAVPRLVVVDDTDPTIQYSGAFSLDSTGLLDTQGFGGPVYNRTITGTTRNGSLSYNFKGSFVRAMVAATGFYSWNCSVDDHPIPSFAVNSSQLTNYVACDSAGILTGSTNVHTLDVNFFFSPDSPANSSLWLDSIQYQPLLSDPLDAVTLRIDNSDPSVVYSNSSGAWIQGAGSNGTVVNGASMSFTFNGSSASLYGINLGYPDFWNPTTAYYLIDGKLTDFDLPGSTTVASLGSRVASVINCCSSFQYHELSSGSYHKLFYCQNRSRQLFRRGLIQLHLWFE